MPPKKILAATVSLLAVCLFSLCTARITEAAPTPDDIISKLEARLNSILSDATDSKNKLSNKVTTQINKFNADKLSRKAFCSELDSIQVNSEDARKKFDKQITTATRKKIKDLQKMGADSSYINTAEGMEDDAHTNKHALYDDLDTAIDNAKKVPSPWCT